MMLRKALGIILLCSSLSCTYADSQKLTPALLDNPSPETRKELETAIGSLLNSQPIKLSDEVFTKTNTVIVDRVKSNLNGPIFNGRELGKADSFSLLSQRGKCLIRHTQSRKTISLVHATCIKSSS